MNPGNRGYYLRNRGLAEPHDKNGDTVLNGEEQPTVEDQQVANPIPPVEEIEQQPELILPPADPVQPERMAMQLTGLQLEKFAGDGSTDAKSWLKWFNSYCLVHKQDEGQQLLTLPFYLTSHARIWYEALPDATKVDLEALKTAFEARFKKQDILDTELLDMTQRPDECCSDYFSRVLKKSQQSTADMSLVTSLAIKGLKPAIKLIVMPQNPKDFDDARQRAILAEKAVLSSTVPVAAYAQSNEKDRQIAELTEMMKNLQSKLNNQQSSQKQHNQQNQHYNSDRRGGRRGSWRGRGRQHHGWRNPAPWQQQQQQHADQYYQQQPAHNQQGRNDRPQQNCTGCKGEDLNCNFPDYCTSFRSYCNKCRQRGHYVAACPNSQ